MRGAQGLPTESESDDLVAGVDEIFDLQVLPNIRRGEILAPHQWFEQPSIVTVKGGMLGSPSGGRSGRR